MSEIGGVVSIWDRRERYGKGDASRFLSIQSPPSNIANSSSLHTCDHTTASTPDTTYWCICFHEANVHMVPRMLWICHVKEMCLMDDEHVDEVNGCEELEAWRMRWSQGEYLPPRDTHISGFWIAALPRFSFEFLPTVILNIQGIPKSTAAILATSSELRDAANVLLAVRHSISTSAAPDAAPRLKSSAHAPMPFTPRRTHVPSPSHQAREQKAAAMKSVPALRGRAISSYLGQD
ncbi:hypothetical protein FIBSPDRAFT_539170 [Athelia psychrophila]|uniref:Uncharacterized protein n=1 Tax=Athelia psychrophila TaxID=1759441 RepID=A0A166J2V8_9AGAM|nr:hypothetical protein FIBSPDRAFT_539170 [Fibularhizoctonia sp. CBS 109695]